MTCKNIPLALDHFPCKTRVSGREAHEKAHQKRRKMSPHKEMTVSRFLTTVAMTTQTASVCIMSGQFSIHILGINRGTFPDLELPFGKWINIILIVGVGRNDNSREEKKKMSNVHL
ncbi:hypothetical protein CEXT_245821 [Caerostris extrusa]|uniref:Uncharacterized protein n=1 Tax=Caerostris extrusa TaxID=172846 RepID=A0AAV4WG12_CAEEX|nr:hypothetical protein CEXT_245821 [Caerostris extrusa]